MRTKKIVMKKIISTQDGISIISSGEPKELFPVGFEYMLGQTIYKVDKVINKDPHSDMRRVITSEGSVEILPVESIKKDMKEYNCRILETGIEKKEKDGSSNKDAKKE
jgi:hypothetical protein